MSSETSVLPFEASSVRAARAGMTSLVMLSMAHFFVDLYSAAIGTLQPLLVAKFNLTLAQAGILGGVLVFSSSVTQPAYGYLSDRIHTRMFSALAPAVAGIFISALGVAPGFPWLLLMACLGGTGIASFHPHASARATAAMETNKGRWMAVFISAGTLGMALGPTFYSAMATRVGLDGLLWAAIPGILMSAVLIAVLPHSPVSAHASRSSFDWKPLLAVWKPLTILYFLVFIRSILQITFAQFLPLYLHREQGFSLPDASYCLSLYLTAGAVGGFVGGYLSDRLGGRRVILLSMLGCLPFLAVFFLTTGWMSIAGLTLGGLLLLFTIPVNVVMGQQLVPAQAGTVSALMMGFAWGMAGLLFIPLVGWASDHYSMHHVLASLLVFPVVGAVLTLKLPKD